MRGRRFVAVVALTLVATVFSSPTAVADSIDTKAIQHSTDGDTVTVGAERQAEQDSGASVDSSVVESGEVRVGVAPAVERRLSCWQKRDAGNLDLEDPTCKNVTWTAGANGVPDDNHDQRIRLPVPTTDEEPVDSVPDATALLEYAVARVQAQGAGLVKQPTWDTLIDVPTLVYVTSPTQTLTTTLFGAQVTLTLEATRFSYDFGDGTAPLVTTDPGAPYPATRVYHVYQRKQPDVVITLTTTWRGSVTSPFDGSTASLNGVVTTVESTQPFKVCKAHIYTVPLPEERTREEQAHLDEFERRSTQECHLWNTTPTH